MKNLLSFCLGFRAQAFAIPFRGTGRIQEEEWELRSPSSCRLI